MEKSIPFSIDDPKENAMSRRGFMKLSAMGVAGCTAYMASGCSHHNAADDNLARNCQNLSIKENANVSENRVFQSTRIGNIRIKNRIIKSAMALNLPAVDNSPFEALIQNYTQVAKGGVGVLITGEVAVSQDGKSAFENALILDKDDKINDFKLIADRVHRENTAIIMQVGHDGPITRRTITGLPTVGPSQIADNAYNEELPRVLSESEINDIVGDFIQTIVRAQKAGFDGVQLFAAHGGLLSAFISPASNKREDKWGGSTSNRFRIIRKIFQGAKRKVKEFPILIKINGYDFQDNGMKITEAVSIAGMLENVGCAAIEVSSGVPGDGFSTVRVDTFPTQMVLDYHFAYEHYSEFQKRAAQWAMPLISWKYVYKPLYNYNVCVAKRIKRQVGIPVIVVGGIREFEDIERIVGNGMADYVGMARPFIIEPDIVNQFKSKEKVSSDCINCGHCILALEKRSVECF